MAGPGKRGVPAKGGQEEVEWQLTKAQVLELRHQNMTHAEIAAVTGYERSTVSKLLKRIFRELLEEAGAEEVRAVELARLEKIISRLMPALDPADGDALPSLKAIDAYIRLSTHKANLVGAFAPKSIDLSVKQLDEEESERAEQLAEATERFMELADKIAAAGVGSGRATTKETEDGDIVDAVVVEDSEDGPKALGPGDDGWTETEDDDLAPAVGSWVNGKFKPNLSLIEPQE